VRDPDRLRVPVPELEKRPRDQALESPATSATEERPKVVVEAIRPFEELFDALDEAGFDAERRAPWEQRGAEPAVEAIALYLAEKLADPVFERLMAALRGWVDSWLRRFLREKGIDPSGVRIPIYGPNGEVLVEVEVDE